MPVMPVILEMNENKNDQIREESIIAEEKLDILNIDYE